MFCMYNHAVLFHQSIEIGVLWGLGNLLLPVCVRVLRKSQWVMFNPLT